MKYTNPDLDSSYRENNLGKDLYDAVLEHKPKKIIEFGSLYGYSTVAMALALHELGEGSICVYDLFESYMYTHSAHKHTSQESLKKGGLRYYLEAFIMDIPMWLHPSRNMISRRQVRTNLEKYGVSNFVTLKKMNFKDWIKNPEPFDMMHFDVANNGDTLRALYEAVKPFVQAGSHVYFEGGSAERDSLVWMEKHGLKKISESGVPYRVVNENFPSLSVIERV
ncbi:hypothetical protein EBR66_00630 [bacterium]|nr:hypothetical protein [bacterium]